MNISVLVPCFNAAVYLGEALESACVQVPTPFEVIVVDDGSTDGSAAIAERFGPRVRCDRQPHLGISAARNRALSLAQGEAVAFLDADDAWPSDSLGSRRRCLAADQSVDCAVGLVEEFISPELDAETRRGLFCLPHALPGRLMGAMLVRREVFDRIGPFDTAYELGETIDWVARANEAGIVMETVNQVVLRRRIHLSNTGARLRHQRTDYLRLLRASLDRQHRTASSHPLE